MAITTVLRFFVALLIGLHNLSHTTPRQLLFTLLPSCQQHCQLPALSEQVETFTLGLLCTKKHIVCFSPLSQVTSKRPQALDPNRKRRRKGLVFNNGQYRRFLAFFIEKKVAWAKQTKPWAKQTKRWSI